jgi:hypothetical protein
LMPDDRCTADEYVPVAIIFLSSSHNLLDNGNAELSELRMPAGG